MVDRSKEDWRLCCGYFERCPDSSVDDALAAIDFTAQRPNMEYYKELTLGKARAHVHRQLGRSEILERASSSAAPAGNSLGRAETQREASSSAPSAGISVSKPGVAASAPALLDQRTVVQLVQDLVDKALDQCFSGPKTQESWFFFS